MSCAGRIVVVCLLTILGTSSAACGATTTTQRNGRAEQTTAQTGTHRNGAQRTDAAQTHPAQTADPRTADPQTADLQTAGLQTADPQTDPHQPEVARTDPPRTDAQTDVPGTDAPQTAAPGPDEPQLEGGPGRSASEPPALAGVRAQLAIFERQAGELAQVATLVEGARAQAQARRGPIPPICEDRRPIEELRMLGTRGGAGSSSAISAAQALDAWCARFDLWSQPDERITQYIVSYVQRLDRISGWMRDIQRCEGTTGAERARCENAYSSTTRAESEEARRILVLLDEHRRELAGVEAGSARFACTTPVLMRIEASTWVGTTARAQMTSLPRQAEEVCHSMGVSERDLREAARDLGRSLDQAESAARSQRRSLLESAEALRPVLGE